MATITSVVLKRARVTPSTASSFFFASSSSAQLTPIIAHYPPRPSTSFLPAALASLIPDTLPSLRELLPPWVFAVPKSKTTHSKKNMRSSNKGLKEQHNIVACPSCGTPKRAHHLCHECYVDFRKEIHQEAKEFATNKKGKSDSQVVVP